MAQRNLELLAVLPTPAPSHLLEMGKVLDNFYTPTRYSNGHPEGPPYVHYGPLQSTSPSTMPVRSSRTSVHRWPARCAVLSAARAWAASEAPRHDGLLRLGIFGSCARGEWGVGSDLDLIAIVEYSASPFMERALAWNLLPLPVPSEILVYTRGEWDELRAEGGRFARTVEAECLWLWKFEPRAASTRGPERKLR